MRLLCSALCLVLAQSAWAAPEMGYDLRTNDSLAHVYRDGVVADAANPGFVKYIRDMRGNWKRGGTEGGRPAAYLPVVQANLWIPVGRELAGKPLVVEAGVHPIGDQRMDAFVNGKKIGSPTIKSGWQNIRVKVPSGLVKAGLVKVRLHFSRSKQHAGMKTAAAIRFVRLAPQDAPPAPADEAGLAAWLAHTKGKGLQLPDGAGADYYVTPVKGLSLVGSATGGTVEVYAQTDGRKAKRIGGGAKLSVKLDAYAGKAVRLMLRGKGGAVSLSGGRIKGGTAGAPKAPTKPKYVIFWLIDTLRADKLDFYPYPNANRRKKPKTPHLSALAKESTVFAPYWVQGNESKASHASLFTGAYPVAHKVYNHKAKLASSYTTIAEAFKKAGYRTGGFVSNGYVSKKWNFSQGFKDFTNFIREGKANNAKAVVKAARPWIDKHKAKPFYLYLGTSDPHVTYRAHKEFIGQYDKGKYTGRYKKNLSGGELGKLKQKKRPPSDRDRVRIEALYENEIAFNDHHFGVLVKHLKDAGIYDDTMIIVSSDHGDEFWERGSCGHGHNLNQELINVPLFIKWPSAFPAGKRASFGADGVDLLPTLMGLLGQKVPGDVQGHSLLPFVWASGAVYPRATMASMGTSQYALQSGNAKVIMRSERSVQVYDTAKDPGELKDVYGEKTILTLAAMDPLAIFLTQPKTWNKAAQGSPNVQH
jgi:arylsulfatase A-like enzyme